MDDDLMWYDNDIDPYEGLADYEYMLHQQELLLREEWEVEEKEGDENGI